MSKIIAAATPRMRIEKGNMRLRKSRAAATEFGSTAALGREGLKEEVDYTSE
jgi:hypothetical protein